MAGSARSKVTVTMMSVRVAGAPDYIPAHTVNGKDKPTSQRALFRVFHNDGGAKANVFSCTAWGKLADAISRGCAAGKEISIHGELKSYDAKVWQDLGGGNRQPQRNPDGSFVMTTKVGIKVDSVIFGNDSNTLAVDEIGKGLRPPMYNVVGSQDEMTWKNMCKQRNAEQFIPGSPRFGYAEVKMPANAQVVTTPQTGTGYAQPQGGGYPPAGYQAPPAAPGGYIPPQQGGFQPPAAPAYGAPAAGGYQPPPATHPAYQTPGAYTPPQAPAYTPPPAANMAPGGYQPPQAPAYAPPAAPTANGYQPPQAPAAPATMTPAVTPAAAQKMSY